jgi:23S rRNA pseudouridine1911/1915/1917 synthase
MGNPDPRSGNYSAHSPQARRLRLTIPLALAGSRLDSALAKLLPDQSRSRLAKLIDEGHVTVDGARVAGRMKLKSGEEVEVALVPRAAQMALRAEAIALAIVHEDEDLLVLDKPAGLVVHPGSGNWAGTMLNALLHHAPALERLPRAGIVHRLDKDTSGLIVVAKTEEAQLDLVRQLAAHTVKRTYLAVVRGKIAAGGTIDAPIGRHPVHRTKMAVVERGKPAVTHFRVREAFARHTLLECDLETGRTHQIRVHLASLGHPVEGDPLYARKGPVPMARQALHAWKLAFRHPGTGEAMRFESKPPADFQELLKALRRG